MSSCKMVGQRVSEVGSRPSSALSLRVGMWLCWVIFSSRVGRGSRVVCEVNDSIGLLPKSADIDRS
jgi:hypothetical protein